MKARGPQRDQVIYSRLETDAEVLDRASLLAGHRVRTSCCQLSTGLPSTDDLASVHGVTRRIIKVVPP